MPGLGDPLVSEMRRLAAAHAAFPGVPPPNTEELLERYDGRDAPAATDGIPDPLSRRDFLRRGAAIGAGVAGASVLGWGRAAPALAQSGNVVIVGAGLGGLACAYRLMQHGIAPTVYESRDRVGGRCWTVRVFDNGQTAEHGGQYIDSRHHQIRQLAKDLHVPLVDT